MLSDLPEFPTEVDFIQFCPGLFWAIKEGTLLLGPDCFRLLHPLMELCRQSGRKREQASKWLLAINGEHESGWRTRLKLLEEGVLNLQQQLRFNWLVGHKIKKSSYPYFSRLKVVQKLLQQGRSSDNIFELQNSYFTKYLSANPRNYHLWNYRIRLVRLLRERGLAQGSECGFIRSVIQKQVSNRSAYDYLLRVVREEKRKEEAENWADNLLQVWRGLYSSQQAKVHLVALQWFRVQLTR